MMNRCKPLFFFTLLIVEFSFGQVDYYSPVNIYRFAESLFSEKEYLRGINEYERYIFLSDSGINHDSTYLKIGIGYRLIGEFGKAFSSFQKISPTATNEIRSKKCYQTALTYFELHNFNQSLIILDECANENPPSVNNVKLRGINHLYTKQWEKAKSIFVTTSSELYNIADEGEQLPYKSITQTIILATLIPGAGKFYVDRSVDGFYSLLTIGITGWQAYDGFRRDGIRSTKGWIYSTLCCGFYLGSIYGSIVALNVYNENLEIELLKKIDLSIHVAID